MIEYVHQTWNCPIFFYSGSYFGDETAVRGNKEPSGTNYEVLVNKVLEIADKWNEKEGYTIKVLDLYHDADFNSLVSDSDYEYLMGDAVHPRQAGYLVWWVPRFEEFLYEEIG